MKMTSCYCVLAALFSGCATSTTDWGISAPFTLSAHRFFAGAVAPAQFCEFDFERSDGENLKASVRVVTEDGETSDAFSHLSLPLGVSEQTVRVKRRYPRGPCVRPLAFVNDRSVAGSHEIGLQTTKGWEPLIEVPGLCEEPNIFSRATAWVLTPATMVLDVPTILTVEILKLLR